VSPDELVRRAAQRIDAGELAAAAEDLASAAASHRDAGRAVDESRVRQALATVQRTLGAMGDAEVNALRARELAPEATPWRVSAETELGEIYLFGGRHLDAIAMYEAALKSGDPIGLVPIARAALLRRIAIAFALSGDHASAALAAEEAAELYAEGGNAGAATRARIESATALVEAGLAGPASRAIADTRARAADDHAAQAELDLLESARALKAKDPGRALEHARHARAEALEGGAVLPYVAAALAIAELLEHGGDRLGAYASLAVGWVTAADKIGQELAATMFRGPLTSQRERWGEAAFEAVKAEYYAARRRS
jgi:tetratricopeptide (TPR) repeat protein